MNKYEYDIIDERVANDNEIIEVLNELGKDGWHVFRLDKERNDFAKSSGKRYEITIYAARKINV